jgi:hypothetical protein
MESGSVIEVVHVEIKLLNIWIQVNLPENLIKVFAAKRGNLKKSKIRKERP